MRSAGALGVTLFDGADAGPVPTPFVAVTVNEYTSPFVNPDTTIKAWINPLAQTGDFPLWVDVGSHTFDFVPKSLEFQALLRDSCVLGSDSFL